jgi:hypothetical protein
MNARTKIAAALRGKYRSPADALRALGLDADLVDPASTTARTPGDDRTNEMRREIEQLLSDLRLDDGPTGKILELLKKYAPDGRTVGDNDKVDEYDKVRKFLGEKGFDDADIDEAIALGRRGATDRIPRNGLGAMDEALRVAAAKRLDDKFGIRRIITVDAGRGEERRPAAPSRAAVERLHAKYPGLAKIQEAGR